VKGGKDFMLAMLSKNFFLYISQNKLLNKAAKKWGFKLGAAQVVAGESIKDMTLKVRELNEKGLVCTLDHLGEFVLRREEAEEATDYNIKTLEAIGREGLNSQLSVKLTQLGLDIDQEFCLENMRRILETARSHHIFVTVDMEDYAHCHLTIDMVKKLRQTYENVGTVIQAYLYRSENDIKELKGIPLRLVKGAYKESSKVAIQDKTEIDCNYLLLIKEHLMSGSFTAIATHDHNIIEKVKEFAKVNAIPRDQFEFQMLYGFRKELQLSINEEGYKMRVYVPFGRDWFGYYMRRLAERPQNIAFALKGIFKK
jgi:proline dehydrogenase